MAEKSISIKNEGGKWKMLSKVKTLFFNVKGVFERKISPTRYSSSSGPANADLSIFDTSLVFLPKYSELTPEDKNTVDGIIKTLSLDDYASFVKFGDVFTSKSNAVTEVIIQVLGRISKDNPQYNLVRYQNDAPQMIPKLIRAEILHRELITCVHTLEETKKDAYLHAVALDRYIKRETLRKLDFLGVFGKANRLLFLRNQHSLEEAKQRVLISIKVLEQHSLAVAQTLKGQEELQKSYEIYSATKDRLRKDANHLHYQQIMVNTLDILTIETRNFCELLWEKEEKISYFDFLDKTHRMLESTIDSLEDKMFLKEKILETLSMIYLEIDLYRLAHKMEKELFVEEIHTALSNHLNMDQVKDVLPSFYRRLCIILTILHQDENQLSQKETTELFSLFASLAYSVFCFAQEWYYANTEEKYHIGVKIPDKMKEKMIKECLQYVAEVIQKQYDIVIQDKEERKRVLETLVSKYNNWLSLILNDNIVEKELLIFDDGIRKENADFTNLTHYVENYLSLGAFSFRVGSDFSIQPKYLISSEEERELFSFIDLYAYFQFNPQVTTNLFSDGYKKYDVTSSDFIAEILGGIDYWSDKEVKNLLTQIIYKELQQYFDFKSFYGRKEEKREVAYFPKLVDGIRESTLMVNRITHERYTLGQQNMPKDIFHEGTKGLFLHDDFKISSIFLRSLEDAIPNVEYFIISMQKFKRLNEEVKNGDNSYFREVFYCFHDITWLVVDTSDENKFDKVGRPQGLNELKKGYTIQFH